MNDTSNHQTAGTAPAGLLLERLARLLARFPSSVTQFVLRAALAVPFWRSGLTKWDGFLQLSDSAVYLFAQEFRLHIFGQVYSYPIPTFTAFFAGSAEIVLPVLLVIGLATRFSALGLLIMTGIIQITVPDGWANFHLPWAAMALAIMTFGPGRLSADCLIAHAWRR